MYSDKYLGKSSNSNMVMTKEQILTEVSAAIDSGLDVVVLQGETVQVAKGTERAFVMFEPYADQVSYMKGAARLYDWQSEIDKEDTSEGAAARIVNPETFELHGRRQIRDFAKNIANVQLKWEAEQTALSGLSIKEIK